MDAAAHETNAPAADGKAVWSWHPDAGVKFAGSDLQATVTKKPGHRLLNAHIFCCGGRQRLIPCWGWHWRGLCGRRSGWGDLAIAAWKKGGVVA